MAVEMMGALRAALVRSLYTETVSRKQGIQPMASEASLFTVSNNHGVGSGEPPHIDGDTRGRYHGYFENEHGEQALFTVRRVTA
jgi:hypothetical protein